MKSKATRTRIKTAAALLALAAFAAVYFVLSDNRIAKTPQDEALYVDVQEGPLVLNILEAGSIKPREQLIIKSEVEGSNAILYIVPEGTRVQKGQLLVELDVSSLADRRVEQDIAVAEQPQRESLREVRRAVARSGHGARGAPQNDPPKVNCRCSISSSGSLRNGIA